MEYLEIINSKSLQITNIFYVILKNQLNFLFNTLNKINCHGSLNKLRKDISKSIEGIKSIDEEKYFEIQNLIKKNIPLLPELAIDNLDELNNYLNEMKDKTMEYIVEQYYNNRILILYYNGYFRFDNCLHIHDLKSIFYNERSYEFWSAKNIQKNEYQNQLDLFMAEKKFKQLFMPTLLDYLQENRQNYRSTHFMLEKREFVEVYDKCGKKSFDVNDHPFKIMVSPCYELGEIFIFVAINYRFYKKKGCINIETLKSQMATILSSIISPSITDLQLKGTVTSDEKDYLMLMDELFGLINYTTIPTKDINPEIITAIIDKYAKDLERLEGIDKIDYLSLYRSVESNNAKLPSIIETALTVVKGTTDIANLQGLSTIISDDKLLKIALIRLYIYEMYILSVVSEYFGTTNRVSYSFIIEPYVNNTSPVITPYKYISHFRELNVEEIFMFFDVKIEEFPDLKPMLLSTDMVGEYFKTIKKEKSLDCLEALEDYLIDNAIVLHKKKVINIKKREKLLLMDHEEKQEFGVKLLEKLFSILAD